MSEERFHDAVRRSYDELAEEHREARKAEEEPGIDLVDDLARDLPARARVLDAGCGAGMPVLSRFVTALDVVGVDFSRNQLRLAREHVPAAPLVQGDMTALPFRDGAFDGLVALHSIIHVPRDEHSRAFAEFHRVLADGAPALVTSGTDAWEGVNADWHDSGVEMRWSYHGRETTLDLLADAGFAVESVEEVPDALGGDEFLFVRARA